MQSRELNGDGVLHGDEGRVGGVQSDVDGVLHAETKTESKVNVALTKTTTIWAGSRVETFHRNMIAQLSHARSRGGKRYGGTFSHWFCVRNAGDGDVGERGAGVEGGAG